MIQGQPSRGARQARAQRVSCLCAALAVALAAGSAHAIVSSNAGADAFSGIYINQLLGANRFYDAGYTGTRAVVANIEAGHVWNGHETLSHVSTFIHDSQDRGELPVDAPVGTPYQVGAFDRHATWVGQAIAGRGTEDYQQGIAHGATLWSASIATRWRGANPYRGSFERDNTSFEHAYVTALRDGVGGRTADVINSSWGFFEPTGFNFTAVAIDGLLDETRKIGVFSAGNSGSFGPDTVGGAAAGFNSISVGALASDIDPNPFERRSSFSSYGPNSYFDPITETVIPGVRASVHITAPGQDLTLGFYGGTTGGNFGGTDSTNGSGEFYSANRAGTSFSAPIVAGGASLLVDAGYDRFSGGNSIDGRVIRAVLLNSADKLPGWNNGQTTGKDGVVRTTQALDWEVGAGRMNLARAFEQYLNGSTDVTGANAGTKVQPIGWDYGTVTEKTATDYMIGKPLVAGNIITATLSWFTDSGWDTEGDSAFIESFDNLDLQVWRTDGRGTSTLIGESASLYNTIEHLHFTVPEDGSYFLRVVWEGEQYDFVEDLNSEEFGLAWSVVIPAPSSGLFLLIAGGFAARRRRA